MSLFSLSFSESILHITHRDTGFSTAPGSDFFRMHVDTGENRELEVISSRQVPRQVKATDAGLSIFYDGLIAEDGSRLNVALTVHVLYEGEDSLVFRADLENREDGVRVNELQLPVLEAERLASAPEEEVAYIPDGLGARYCNPRQWLLANYANTEYLHADYKTIWYNMAYPHGGQANAHLSMPWYTVESGGYSFTLSKLTKEFRLATLSLGRTPLSQPDTRLLFAASYYPAAEPGERLELGDSVFSLTPGDWRTPARRYREFYDSVNPSPIPDSPRWIREMTGWQRIILKHQYGEIFFRYADLPRIYKNGAKYGIHTLLVFGWWRGRFDNGYPVYEPDEALGGEAALMDAIRKVQELGGRVILYSNGNLIDVATDYYREIGQTIAAKDIDGNEYREHYKFSNNGTLLDRYGYKSFVTACHATEAWREKLLETGQKKRSFSPDGIFYDQLCCCHKCCFDRRHLHGARIDLEPAYRLENASAIRRLITPEESFGTELICDRFTPYVDYIHGCGMAMSYSAAAYPDLYRHTFPEVIVSNRWAHAEEPGYRKKLNYAFVTGLIFDISIYRGRMTDMSGAPHYAEYVASLLALRQEYRDFFYDGRFISVERELALPGRVHAAAYEHSGKLIVALCNNSDEAVTVTVFGHTVTLKGEEACVLPVGKEKT